MHGKTTVIHNTAEAVRSYTVAVRREFGEAPMYAFDATFWGTLGWFGMGVSLTYCTNFSAGALYFRPELGFGDAPIGPVWVRGFIGWPLHMTDKPVGPLPPLNHPHLGVRATIPLDTVAPTDYGD